MEDHFGKVYIPYSSYTLVVHPNWLLPWKLAGPFNFEYVVNEWLTISKCSQNVWFLQGMTLKIGFVVLQKFETISV